MWENDEIEQTSKLYSSRVECEITHTHTCEFLIFYLLDQHAFVAITGMFLFYFALIHLRGLSPRRILLFPVLLLSLERVLSLFLSLSHLRCRFFFFCLSIFLALLSSLFQATLPTNIPLGPSSVHGLFRSCNNATMLKSFHHAINVCSLYTFIQHTNI